MADVEQKGVGGTGMGEEYWERVAKMRERSGSAESTDALVTFLYVLMRDHLPSGYVEEIMRQLEAAEDGGSWQFTNGWLAQHAKDVAERLTGPEAEVED